MGTHVMGYYELVDLCSYIILKIVTVVVGNIWMYDL